MPTNPMETGSFRDKAQPLPYLCAFASLREIFLWLLVAGLLGYVICEASGS
jgi:hypothetical protein